MVSRIELTKGNYSLRGSKVLKCRLLIRHLLLEAARVSKLMLGSNSNSTIEVPAGGADADIKS
jgi:hypothetical protein